MAAASDSAQQQLGFIERLQRQQQELQQQQQQQMKAQNNQVTQNGIQGQEHLNQNGMQMSRDNPSSMPANNVQPMTSQPSSKMTPAVGCEKTIVLELLPILLPDNSTGMKFRSSYNLSFGLTFQLPPILTVDEYYKQFGPGSMPKYDVAALQAAQFAEHAIGAMICGERSTMFKLINASILCLQDSVKEPVHKSCRFELARTFFLHSILRCYDDDMERCFKYRRAAMNTLVKLNVGILFV